MMNKQKRLLIFFSIVAVVVIAIIGLIAMPHPAAIGQSGKASALDSVSQSSGTLYFGASNDDAFGNGEPHRPIEVYFLVPRDALLSGKFYLGGKWRIEPEFAENAVAPAKIAFRFTGKSVYISASGDKDVSLQVFLDGSNIGTLHVQEKKSYPVVRQGDGGEHTIELVIPDAGLRVFSLTVQ